MSKLIPLDYFKERTRYRVAFSTAKDDVMVYLPKLYFEYENAKRDIEKLLDLGIKLENIRLEQTYTQTITFDKYIKE